MASKAAQPVEGMHVSLDEDVARVRFVGIGDGLLIAQAALADAVVDKALQGLEGGKDE